MKSSKRIKKTVGDKEKSRKNRITDLEDLMHEELSGAEDKNSSLDVSSTDEDEGSGDGNIGRSKDDMFSTD